MRTATAAAAAADSTECIVGREELDLARFNYSYLGYICIGLL